MSYQNKACVALGGHQGKFFMTDESPPNENRALAGAALKTAETFSQVTAHPPEVNRFCHPVSATEEAVIRAVCRWQFEKLRDASDPRTVSGCGYLWNRARDLLRRCDQYSLSALLVHAFWAAGLIGQLNGLAYQLQAGSDFEERVRRTRDDAQKKGATRASRTAEEVQTQEGAE